MSSSIASSLLLSCLLASLPDNVQFAERCTQVRDRVHNAPDGADLAYLARNLAPPRLESGLGRLPSLESAIAAWEDARRNGNDKGARDALEETLDALCSQVEWSISVETHSQSNVVADQQSLSLILQRPQFRARRGAEWPLARLLSRLWDVIKEFIQARGFSSFSSVTRFAFLAFVVLGTLLLGVRLWRRRPGLDEETPPDESFRERLLSPDELRTQALAALGRKDGREAIRLQMRALVSEVERGGRVGIKRGSTNREIVRALSESGSPESTSLAEAVSWFERTFYGLAEIAPDEAERFSQHIDSLRAALVRDAGRAS
jgi:hypothetical protein